MQTQLYAYLLVYVAIIIGTSWWVAKREDSEGFLIAGRDRNWLTLAASKFAAAIGVAYFIAYTGYAYEYGLGVYTIIVGVLTGYMLFAFWAAPRIHAPSHSQRLYTQGDFVFDATQHERSRTVTNSIAITSAFVWLMTAVIGGAKIISHFNLLSYELAVLATVLVMMIYIMLAGFKAVLITDVLQAVIIFILVGFLCFIMVQGESLRTVLAAAPGSVDIATAVGFLLFGVLSVFSQPNWYQLCYAAKCKRTTIIGMGISVVPIVLVATLLMVLGMFMYVQNPHLDSGLVFLAAMQDYLPASLLPIGMVLFFAGLMSSGDSNVYAITSHIAFMRRSKRPVESIRLVTAVLSLLCIPIALLFRDIVDVVIVAALITIILSAPMMYIIGGGKNHYRFLGSTFGGIIGMIAGLYLFGIEPAAMLIILVGSLLGFVYNGWLAGRR